MADDIILGPNIDGEKADHREDEVVLETATDEKQLLPLAQHDEPDAYVLSETETNSSHDVANVVAAIDAFLAEPHGEQEEEEEAEQGEQEEVPEAAPVTAVVEAEAEEAKPDTRAQNAGEEASTEETTEKTFEETDHEVSVEQPAAGPEDDALQAPVVPDTLVDEAEYSLLFEDDASEMHEEETADKFLGEKTHDNEDDSQAHIHEDYEDITESRDSYRRTSSSSTGSTAASDSERRGSMRTEALIQAAARAVVATISEQDAGQDHLDLLLAIPGAHDDHQERTDNEGEEDVEVDDDDEEHVDGGLDDDDVFSDRSPRSSLGSFEHNSGSSNNGGDDHQLRKTFADDMAESHLGKEIEAEDRDDESETGSVCYHERSPRISDITGISHMSHYEQHDAEHDGDSDDNDHFGPQTLRGTPRHVFRTASAVRAIQMSSPSPSVIFGGSPRAAARRRRLAADDDEADGGQSIGSAAAYSSLPESPSKNPTPTRFKVFSRPEPAPLVLLHATVMSSRWVWSDVMRSLDESLSRTMAERGGSRPSSILGSSGAKAGHLLLGAADDALTSEPPFEPSAALKRLHAAWSQLHEYSLGSDIVAERGILLPHPQNDFEVLEERLLEALELPLRRRARILECGHYLGPSNEDDDEDDEYDEDDEDDDYYGREAARGGSAAGGEKRHWCTTCRSDIRYESLGAERVFRVKVYASNGLMTAGAWGACWHEMERVDVEIEPIVADAALLRELNQLRIVQQQKALQKQQDGHEIGPATAADPAEDEVTLGKHMGDVVEEQMTHAVVDRFHLTPSVSHGPVSPPLRNSPVEPPALTTTDRVPDAERRRREAEERLREIYGRTPPRSVPTPEAMADDMASLPEVHPTATEASTIRSMDDHHPEFGPSPPSPSAEAYERREERRQRQFSSSTLRPPYDEPKHGYEYSAQRPYESASLPELLLAAVKVFLRDRKHVLITVLSAVIIVLAVARSREVEAVPSVAPALMVTGSVPDIAPDIASIHTTVGDTNVETVVEKMTVKVFETVTETATTTAVETVAAPTAEPIEEVLDPEPVLESAAELVPGKSVRRVSELVLEKSVQMTLESEMSPAPETERFEAVDGHSEL